MSAPLGLSIFKGTLSQAIAQARGLCVFPSAPGLATIEQDVRYREALALADTRFADSGFLVLCWAVLGGGLLSRISGLRFLKAFLHSDRLHESKSLWIHPTPDHRSRNVSLLLNSGVSQQNQLHYVAPIYPTQGVIDDQDLLDLCRMHHPSVIVVNLGSNIQEPLGVYLKQNLDYAPTILCTGGAIDFLTGAQATIPDWADRIFLGWLFRILTTPRAQAKRMRKSPSKRYAEAWDLWRILCKWRDHLPNT